MGRSVIVAGGRDYNNYAVLEYVLDDVLEPGDEVVSGMARGADTLGIRYAKTRGYHVEEFPALWDIYGKRAGYLRNKQMAEYAKRHSGMLVAFWDGQSRGTKHMIDLARFHGLRIRVERY